MDDYSILLVDDEPNILRSLKRVLRADRARVLTANDGLDALEVVQREPIQLLITDNIMPRMTGIELIKRVKECSPDTMRIILSGQSDMEAVLSAVNECEVYRFILKPWNDTDLRSAISLALAHYKLAEDNRSLLSELKEKTRLLEVLKGQHPELLEEMTARTMATGGH